MSKGPQSDGRPRPLQFTVAGALAVLTAFAVLFAGLRAFGVSAATSLIVSGIVLASVISAFALVLAIALAPWHDKDQTPPDA